MGPYSLLRHGEFEASLLHQQKKAPANPGSVDQPAFFEGHELLRDWRDLPLHIWGRDGQLGDSQSTRPSRCQWIGLRETMIFYHQISVNCPIIQFDSLSRQSPVKNIDLWRTLNTVAATFHMSLKQLTLDIVWLCLARISLAVSRHPSGEILSCDSVWLWYSEHHLTWIDRSCREQLNATCDLSHWFENGSGGHFPIPRSAFVTLHEGRQSDH